MISAQSNVNDSSQIFSRVWNVCELGCMTVSFVE